jgi:predicted DNA-binding transcriptional regulator AlpA
MGPAINQNSLHVALLRRREVEKRVALGRSSLLRLIASKSFPTPIRVGKSWRFVEAEIQEWLVKQIELSRQGSSGA